MLFLFYIHISYVTKGNDEARACAALVHLHQEISSPGPQ